MNSQCAGVLHDIIEQPRSHSERSMYVEIGRDGQQMYLHLFGTRPELSLGAFTIRDVADVEPGFCRLLDTNPLARGCKEGKSRCDLTEPSSS